MDYEDAITTHTLRDYGGIIKYKWAFVPVIFVLVRIGTEDNNLKNNGIVYITSVMGF